MGRLPVELRIAFRELRAGLRGFRIFIACLALGVAAIAAVGALSASVVDSLERDGQSILGGDVEFRLLHREADDEQTAAINEIAHNIQAVSQSSTRLRNDMSEVRNDAGQTDDAVASVASTSTDLNARSTSVDDAVLDFVKRLRTSTSNDDTGTSAAA